MSIDGALIQAESEAVNAAETANQSANQADQAAVAAVAAASAQSQLIESTMAASREDAQRARDQAEAEATRAESAASTAQAIRDEIIQSVTPLIQGLTERLDRMEAEKAQPVMIQQTEGATPINPEETEQAKQEENMSAGEGSPTSSAGRRRHGRKRR